jgi:hypothetical protein
MRIEGPDGPIRIVDAAHFCATKIESYLGRGEGDFLHHDMEDLIAVVDSRPELAAEIGRAPEEVRTFIAEQVGNWLGNARFVETLAGHLEGDAASQARRPLLLARLRQIASLERSGTREATPARPPDSAAQPSDAPVSSAPMFEPHLASSLQVLVRSSNLRAVGYDPGTSVLTVEFRNRRIYAYSGVPQKVYDGLLQAGSHGRYFNRWVKDRYRSRRQPQG